jgi:hypothetical protein
MGRRALACLGMAIVVLTAAPALSGASASSASRTALENFGCHRASNSLNRWIEVTGVMRPISGTQHMEMKFQLLRRPPRSHTWVDISSQGNGLGKWIHPTDSKLGEQPGDRWSVQKPVLNLSAPATYRFRVSFRWLGSGGKALDTVVRLSRLCDQY